MPVKLNAEGRKANPINVIEEKVPDYELPNPLHSSTGEIIADAGVWQKQQRPRILDIFKNEVYGKVPDTSINMDYEQRSYADDALNGQAIRKEIRVWFRNQPLETYMDILVYLPVQAKTQAALVFLGLNFLGNHTIHSDAGIALSTNWIPDNTQISGAEGVIDHQATEKSRGTRSSRWPVEKIIVRGFGLATIYYGDLDPDFDDGFQNGIHPIFYKDGQSEPATNEWGAISAWAWGLQRAMDYFEQDGQIDHEHVVAIGHSRLGKTALWAAAQDERFAAVISNNSGCMGAALSRRNFGETISSINTMFPHWFCENFKSYIGREDELPVDQHMLIALVAPRPVYVASAQMDLWCDPKGEFLSLKAAEPVFNLFDEKGVGIDAMPEADSPVWNTLGYHVRTGEHDLTSYDWEHFIQFLEYQL